MGRELNDIETKIIALYNAGWKTRAIGEEVGRTKNSVCGLLSRLRERGHLGAIPKKEPSVDRRKTPAKRTIGNIASIVKLNHFKEIKTKQSKIDAYEVKPIDPNHKGITFDALRNNSCRYIVSGRDDRPHMYCGEPKHHKSYCAYHGSICYMKPERKPPQERGHFIFRK